MKLSMKLRMKYVYFILVLFGLLDENLGMNTTIVTSIVTRIVSRIDIEKPIPEKE